MQPKLVSKKKFYVIGYELKTSSDEGRNFKEIPLFWDHYITNKLWQSIPGKINDEVEMGICCNIDENSNSFSYVIGFETKQTQKPGNNQVKINVPEMEYSVFTTPKVARSEFVSAIQETTKFIYCKWLPDSKYEIDMHGYEFELYDERASKDIDCQMDIYIPVRKKS